jgi:deazaflavin-dependent oxidoreductase (nitroreductase family)
MPVKKKNRKPTSAPGLVRQWLFRVPLLLHGVGIRGVERLIGIDWIVLTTTGRRSGRAHTVMLDVVGHDEARDVWYVQPAYGRTAAWVRNVEADPLAWAEFRGRRMRVHVTDVTGAEGAEVVLRFLRTHPWYGRVIVWFVGYVDRVDRSDEDLRARLTTTPVFAIHAQRESA